MPCERCAGEEPRVYSPRAYAMSTLSLARLQQDWERRRGLVERYLREVLARRRDPIVKELQSAVAYALEGGKRVRALLVLEGAELAGLEVERALPTAAAVECFHAYSLVHDDLPAMDDDRERRGRPTVHVAFGEATAILVGDTLIPLGFELLATEQPRRVPGERALRAVALFAEALGERGLTGGQHLDLKGVDATLWPEVHLRKTARLIEVALAAGAVLGGLPDDELRALRAFGQHLGRMYQLVDDWLDWGRGGQADLSRFMSREEAERLIERQTERALQALEPLGARAARLRALTRWLAQRKA